MANYYTISSAANVTMGNACAVKWTASSVYLYDLTFTCGSNTVTAISKKAVLSGTTNATYTYTGYTFTTATWAKYVTSSTSATCTATLTAYTMSGDTYVVIGSSSKTFTLSVPSSVVPTVSISVSPSTTYISSYPWLTGKSKPKVTITSGGVYGSTIKSTTTTFNSVSSSAASSVTFGAPSTAGTYTVKTTVTDSRGRTASASTSITYVAYSSPTITSVSAYRASDTSGTKDITDGTYGYVKFTYTIASVSSKNSGSVKVQYKLHSASSYTTLSTTTVSAGGTYTATLAKYFTADTGSSYNVLITVTDAAGSTTKSLIISAAFALMHFDSSGTGMGIGTLNTSANQLTIGIPTVADGTYYKSTYTNQAAFRHTHPTTGYEVQMGVGSGGYNRGLYDGTQEAWIIYNNSAGDTVIPGTVTGITSSGSIITGGHSTAIGSIVSNSSTATTTIASTSTDVTNLISISLPAGTWVVSGCANFSAPSANCSVQASISTTSATHSSWQRCNTINTTAYYSSYVNPVGTFSLTSTTTVYLVASCAQSVSISFVSKYLRASRSA